jgi:hypothetical protein
MGIRLAGNRLAYRILITLAISLAASAQPRAVEVWGNIGIANAAGDEGSIGTGAIYGAGVACVFRSKWAADSGGMWATDSGGKWATDSGEMWVQLSPVTGTLDSVTGTVDSVTGMVAP